MIKLDLYLALTSHLPRTYRASGELSAFSRLGGSAGNCYAEGLYANDEVMTIAGDIFLNQATQLKDKLYPK